LILLNSSVKIPFMLRELYTRPEFDSRDLFEPMLEQARLSTVPLEFVNAHGRVRDDVRDTRKLLSDGEPNYQEVARRLFENEFSTLDAAQYALNYASTVSSFKIWDKINTRISPVRQEYASLSTRYNNFLTGLAEKYHCTREELSQRVAHVESLDLEDYQEELAKYSTALKDANPLESDARGAAELAGRALLGMESSLVKPDNSWRVQSFRRDAGENGWQRRKMTLGDLQQVKTTVNDYFKDSQHRARILILAAK
jgi:hypothetical protein